MSKRRKTFGGLEMQSFITTGDRRSKFQSVEAASAGGRRALRRIPLGAVLAGMFAVLLICVFVLRNHSADIQESLMDDLWRPVYRSQETVIIYVSTFDEDAGGESMETADALTMVALQGPLEQKHRPFEVVSTHDLSRIGRSRAARILVGSLDNNALSRSIVQDLRYSVETDAAGRSVGIRDQTSGNRVCGWLSDAAPESSGDCGVAVRVKDPATGAVTVIAAGLGSAGTRAAGEFLVEPRYFCPLARSLSRGWETRNLEVVLRTPLMRGQAGPPRVLAVESW